MTTNSPSMVELDWTATQKNLLVYRMKLKMLKKKEPKKATLYLKLKSKAANSISNLPIIRSRDKPS